MTPKQILDDLPLAMGLQLEAQWWIAQGYAVERAVANARKRDRLRA